MNVTRKSVLFAAMLALGLLGKPLPAAAQAQVFTQRGAFDAAVGAVQSRVDFEDQVDGAVAPALEYPAGRFRSVDNDPNDMVVLGPESAGLSSKAAVSNRNFNPLVVDVLQSGNAVGLDVLSLSPDGSVGDSLVITVDSGGVSQQIDVALTNGGGFVGVVSSAPVTGVSVANPAGVQMFVGVDNVAFASVSEGDPLTACLDKLGAAIDEGIADGSIRRVGPVLKRKLNRVRELLTEDHPRAARNHLRALGHHVRAHRGKKITRERANQLLGLVEECLKLFPSR